MVYETQIKTFNLVETVTTTPLVPQTGGNYIWYIVIMAIAVVASILIVFKVPKVRTFLSQKFHKIFHKPVDEEIEKENLEEQENEEKNK